MEQRLEAMENHDSAKGCCRLWRGHVTIGDWKRKEVEKWCSTGVSNEGLKERTIINKCKSEKISGALYLWITQQ